jgi:hypothetical protein
MPSIDPIIYVWPGRVSARVKVLAPDPRSIAGSARLSAVTATAAWSTEIGWIGSTDAASRIGISRQRLHQLRKAGKIRGIRGPRGAWLYSDDEIHRFAAIQRRPGKPSLAGTSVPGGDNRS